MTFHMESGQQVPVDFGSVIETLKDEVYERVLRTGHILNTQDEDYTTVSGDFTGRTIIRANKNQDQTITVTKPDDSFIGKTLVIRKTNGNPGTSLNIVGSGCTISPADITPIRRVGLSVSLVYTGEGNWDAYGELP